MPVSGIVEMLGCITTCGVVLHCGCLHKNLDAFCAGTAVSILLKLTMIAVATVMRCLPRLLLLSLLLLLVY